MFTFICCKIVLLFEKTENKRKRGRGWPFFCKNERASAFWFFHFIANLVAHYSLKWIVKIWSISFSRKMPFLIKKKVLTKICEEIFNIFIFFMFQICVYLLGNVYCWTFWTQNIKNFKFVFVFLKMGQTRPPFVYFRSFHIY